MKKDIKDILFLFGISVILWILSIAVVSPLIIYLLKWTLKIGTVLFIIAGIISIINTIILYKDSQNKKTQ
jgi:membrane protein implicated in regulation of membrane protease activity